MASSQRTGPRGHEYRFGCPETSVLSFLQALGGSLALMTAIPLTCLWLLRLYLERVSCVPRLTRCRVELQIIESTSVADFTSLDTDWVWTVWCGYLTWLPPPTHQFPSLVSVATASTATATLSWLGPVALSPLSLYSPNTPISYFIIYLQPFLPSYSYNCTLLPPALHLLGCNHAASTTRPHCGRPRHASAGHS